MFAVQLTLNNSDLSDQLQLAVLDLVDLQDSGSSGEVSHTNKLSAAGNPPAVKHRVVQTLLDVRDDLRLLERRRHVALIINSIKQRSPVSLSRRDHSSALVCFLLRQGPSHNT